MLRVPEKIKTWYPEKITWYPEKIKTKDALRKNGLSYWRQIYPSMHITLDIRKHIKSRGQF